MTGPKNDGQLDDWSKTYSDSYFISSNDVGVVSTLVDFIAASFRAGFPSASSRHAIEALDIGCGIGFYTGLIAQALGDSIHLRSLDPAVKATLPYWDLVRFKGIPQPIESESFHRHAIHNPERHRSEPLEHTSFGNGSFDGILGTYVIEYTDQPAAAKELARILRPNGVLVLVLHSHDSLIFRGSQQASLLRGRLHSLLEAVREGLNHGDRPGVLRAFADFKRNSPDFKKLHELEKLIEIAFSIGPRAIQTIEELAAEYLSHNKKLHDFVTGAHVFKDADSVSRLFSPCGFRLIEFSPLLHNAKSYGNGVVLSKV